MKTPPLITASLMAIAVAMCPPHAAGQTSKPITHRVERGDTLELLAAEYYGSRRHAIYIMKANGMTHPRTLKPRERLKIPVSRVITARRGDSLSGLAGLHLGDERRATFLATYNNLKPEDGLAAGQTLRVPFSVVHVAEREVSLKEISLSYFGDKSYIEQIKQYNFFDTSTLAKGTKIVIPVVHVQSRESTPDKESQELVSKRRQEQAVAKENLASAGPLWRTGQYTKVKELLTGIDIDFLDASQAIAVSVLLGGAYVATGDNASAKANFERALERRRDFSLKTFDYSPKILAVWKEAGGTIENGE